MNFFEINLAIDSTSKSWEDLEFATRLMRQLAHKEEFKNKLIDRFTIYMGDFLQEKYIVKTLDSLAKNIEYEFPYTFEKYADYRKEDYADWYKELDIMRNFPSTRNMLNLYAMKEFYQLGDIFSLSIEKGTFRNRKLNVNNIDLKTDKYEGHYYEERELKVTLKKERKDSLHHAGWRVIYQNIEKSDTIYFALDTLSLTIPSENEFDYIHISPTDTIPPPKIKYSIIYSVAEGIVLKNYEAGEIVSIYDITGRVIKQFKIDDSELTIPLKHKGVLFVKIREDWHKVLR